MAAKRKRKRKASAVQRAPPPVRVPKDDPPLSLQPLQFTDAVEALLATPQSRKPKA